VRSVHCWPVYSVTSTQVNVPEVRESCFIFFLIFEYCKSSLILIFGNFYYFHVILEAQYYSRDHKIVSVVNKSRQIKEEMKNLLKQVAVCATQLGEAEKVMWVKFDDLNEYIEGLDQGWYMLVYCSS